MKKITEKNHMIIYSVLFVMLTVLCGITFWHNGLLPIYGIDGLGQYYPAFLYTGRVIRESVSGIFSGSSFRFYDLTIGLGEDMIGTLNYYGFGDPVNLLSVFATKTTGPYLFAFSYYLRLYLGGLAFMFCIGRFRLSELSTAVAALTYAFCGYGIYASGMYIEYASMLFVFPMLLAGCEKVLHGEKGRWILFAAAWYLGLCGFYFTYMCALFLVVYCVVRAYFVYGKDAAGQAVISCLKCALYFALGLCAAAPVLFPSISAFTSSMRSSSSGIGQLFVLSNYIPSLNRRFVSDVNIMNGMRNYPVLLGCAVTFFVAKDKRIMQLRIAVAALFVLLYLPITAIVFNGFSNPRDRWVFEAQFTLCVAFAVVIDKIKETGFARLYNAMLVLAVLNVVTAFWGRYSSLGDDEKSLFVSAEQAVEETSSPVCRSSVIAEDDDLFRVSGEFTSVINERPLNDGMNNDYYGTHYWFSVVSGDAQAVVDEATGRSNDWRSFGLGKDNRYYTAAAVKYYVSQTGSAPDGFVPVEEFEYNGNTRTVFVNENFRGFAYIAGEVDDDKETDTHIIGSCDDMSYDTDTFSCVIKDDAENAVIVTAFPYAKGWSAYIGGHKAETVNSSHFLAVYAGSLKKGDILTLRYRSPGSVSGIIAAVCALTVFCALMFYNRCKGRKNGMPLQDEAV